MPPRAKHDKKPSALKKKAALMPTHQAASNDGYAARKRRTLGIFCTTKRSNSQMTTSDNANSGITTAAAIMPPHRFRRLGILHPPRGAEDAFRFALALLNAKMIRNGAKMIPA